MQTQSEAAFSAANPQLNPHRPPSERDDFTITQAWDQYTPEEHDRWRRLFERQAEILKGRAAPEFLAGLDALAIAADGIPDFRRLNDELGRRTGWQIVAVPGLVPEPIFFEHLANRRFPSTCFIRREDQFDYIQEPDVFHDVFGHVPLLSNPMFADYMQAYGEGGLKALRLGTLDNLARLYWYTGEFGLINTPEGLRILRAAQPAAAEWAERTARPLAGARRGQDLANWVQAELPTESEAYAARQLLRLGTEVEVLAPASLRAAVAKEAAAVARRHRG